MKRDEPASPSVDLEAIRRQHRFDTWWDRLGELTTSATDNRSVVASEICDLEAEVARLQAQVDAMREVVEQTRRNHEGNLEGCPTCAALARLDSAVP